jgi:hypothetical protein
MYWKYSKNNLETIVKKHMFKETHVAPIRMLRPKLFFHYGNWSFVVSPNFGKKNENKE